MKNVFSIFMVMVLVVGGVLSPVTGHAAHGDGHPSHGDSSAHDVFSFADSSSDNHPDDQSPDNCLHGCHHSHMAASGFISVPNQPIRKNQNAFFNTSIPFNHLVLGLDRPPRTFA